MVASSITARSTHPTGVKVVVRPGKGQWTVTSASAVAHSFATKRDAVSAAKKAVAGSGGKVVVHAANGQVKEMLTLGTHTAVRMNAVEGLALNQASRRLIKSFAGKALSSDQERAEILRVFRKARS